ncbi:MAG: bifunctional 3-phosphoshikimate 1-carboxyvinyltransferase/cytidylate kinase [Betaproteobacteria bacterium]|nr:bifunctional 3-phosphoshikimate 1-carboxyvinyltransferase/cytidylate kinase [Betaproteobacteria bacterium]
MSDSRFPPFLDLPPLASAAGVVRLPGSKSISNRMLLLAALAEGATEIRDLLDSDDTQRMLEALAALGVGVEGTAGAGCLIVHGCGGRFPVRDADLFLGNAGTAFRPLTAALAVAGGDYRLSGVARMHERPIGDLVTALRDLGLAVDCLGSEGYPPLRLRGGTARIGGPVKVRGDVSSQFLTALLMALPILGQDVEIAVEGELISKPYIDITLNLMARFGVVVEREGWVRFAIPASSKYRSPGMVHVEGDASGASYFLAAGAIGGGPVRVEGVGRHSIQGDVRFADALAQLGAEITWGDNWIEARAPTAGGLKAFDLDLNHIPDAAMTLAAAALFADGRCRLRNVASWRVKETDRLAAMAAELAKVGATVSEGSDFIEVGPPAQFRGAAIETYDDHRMAMCLSLAALGGVPIRILDPGCVAKTFPDYFDRLAEVTVPCKVPVIAIDGPAASGKGTVAWLVAQALGYRYLDSGALYRIAALAALRAGVAANDEAAAASLAEALAIEFHQGRILLAGEDVTEAIRDERVSQAASAIAALPAVRQALFWQQRAFRGLPGLVAEGRDMGTVVFPEAELKVFLTAGVEERAQRRYKQLIEKGMRASLPDLLHEIAERDARDSQRSVAPLGQAAGAELLDTTGLSPEEARDRILGWFRARACR